MKTNGILFSRNIFYRIYFLLIELTAKHIAAARQIVHVANCVRGGNSFIKKSMLFAVKNARTGGAWWNKKNNFHRTKSHTIAAIYEVLFFVTT
jgi:hypothetical protein